jgi:hypothetical protein
MDDRRKQSTRQGARRIGFAVLVALFAAGLAAPVPAFAQAAAAKKKTKIIRLDAIKVQGRIVKPQAFYVLSRSDLNFEALDLKQSFIPAILQSVQEAPFTAD